MIGPAQFLLGERKISPLAVGPWAGEPDAEALPGILRRLRGEWPCVPFGIAGDAALPAQWRRTGDEPDATPHGHGANAEWTVIEHESGRIVLALDYPDVHPISRLVRTIVAAPDAPRLEFTLEITARRECRLPIGIHPTLVLPGAAGSNRLMLDNDQYCWTPPASAEPGISTFALGASDVPLHAVPLAGGGSVDLTRLPLANAAEELLLTTRSNGKARLECLDAGYAATIAWDPQVFVSCMLWLSNGGRTAYPWSGRFLALGIEPVTAAFDLGTGISANPSNPLAAAGISTARHFSAGEVLTTHYAIGIESLT
jgi:hypothetical protein